MKSLLNIALEAAVQAGAEIMNVYSNGFDVTLKADDSPLTKADELANLAINAFLIKTNIPIISEENKLTPYNVRKQWNRCWMVDPLDGTKEFIKRNGEFTVNIALIEDGKPILGVIYIPVTKVLYYAIVSQQKAYKIQLKSHDFSKQLQKNRETIEPKISNNSVVKVVGSRSHNNKETDSFIQSLKNQGKEVHIVSKGSSLKFCLIAEGDANIYPRFAPTMEWDTAAGHAICNSLGFNVLQTDLSKTLHYNKESLLNPYFIVQ